MPQEEMLDWKSMWEERTGVPHDPDYNYEGAFEAGVEPQPDFESGKFQWPSLAIDPDAEAEASAEPPIEPPADEVEETDEFGGVAETDEFGGVVDKDMKWEKPIPTGQRLIDNYARPVLQGVGSAVGLIIGGGGGGIAGTAVAPGPGTVTGATAGGIAGGSLGYAMGDEIADLMQEWMGYYEPKPVLLNLQQAGENVREGLTYELGGHTLGPAAKAGSKIPGVKRMGKFISSMLPKTDKRAQKKAGEVLAAFTDKGPIIAKNIEEAQALEELIPGLKFDLGQLTGDVNVVKFMKEGVEDAGDLAVARAEQSAKNLKAINDFIKKTKGTKGIDDALKPLKAGREIFDEAEAIAKMNMERQKTALVGKAGPMEIGTTIREPIEAGEKAARKKAGEMFDKVPEQDQIVDDLIDGFTSILKSSHRTEGKKKFPSVLKLALKEMKKGGKPIEAIKKARAKADPKSFTPAHPEEIALHSGMSSAELRAKHDIGKAKVKKLMAAGKDDEAMVLSQKNQMWREAAEILEGTHIGPGMGKYKEAIKKTAADVAEDVADPIMTLKDIQGLRSEILEDLRTAKDKGYPRSYRARLAKAIDLIDQKLGTASGEAGKELQAAQKSFRENVIERYGKGSVGRLLQGEETVGSAAVADSFFKAGPKGEQAAAEFMAVAGDSKEAMKAMETHINRKIFDLRSNVTDEITKASLSRFLKTHKPAINKMGLGGKYNTLVKARLAADKALADSAAFEKSAATRFLDADVNDAVKQAFSKGSKKAAAEDLMLHIKAKPYIREPAWKNMRTGKIYSGQPTHAQILGEIPPKETSYMSTEFESGFLDVHGNFLTKKQTLKKLDKLKSGASPESMSLTRQAKIDTENAITGLQNSMIDEILTDIPLEGTARELLSSGKMAQNFRKYDPALKVIFKDNPKRLKAMHTVRKAIKAFEYRTGEKAEVGERYAADVIRRIAFLQGHTTVAAVDIARKAVRSLRGLSKEKIHKFVNRGILDPDVAWDLIRVAKGGSEKKIAHGMTQSLVRLGLIAPQRKEKERNKR